MLKSDEFEFVMPEDDKCVKKGLKIVVGVITVFIGPNGSGKTTVMRKMASEVGGSIYIPTNRNTLAIYTIKSRKKRPSNINEAIEYFLYACYSDEHHIKSDVEILRKFYSRYGFNNVRWRPSQVEGKIEIIATVETSDGPRDVNLSLAGSGFNVLFPLISFLSFAENNKTVFIELPELHLHPSLQYELAKFMVDIVLMKKLRIVLETHSEHIINGLAYAVASGKISSEKIKIYSFKLKNGFTEVYPLKIMKDGRIKGEIYDFFETNLNVLKEWLEVHGDKK